MADELEKYDENENLSHVLDEETGELVEVTEDMKAMAQYIESQIYGMALVTAVHLRTIRDFRLYLVSGFGNFSDYVNMKFNFSERMAQKYLKVADRFSSFLPETNPGSLKDGIKLDEKVQELSSMGISKLHELTRLPDADFSEVLTKRKVKLADGSTLDLTEYEEKSKREITQEVSRIKKEYQRKLSLQQEDLKKAKGERDHYKGQLDKNQDKIERALELESQFGKDAARMEEIDFNMAQAETALLKVERTFGKVDADQDSPEVVRERIRSFLRSLNRVQVAAQERYPWLIELDDIEEFPSWKMKDGETADGKRETANVVTIRMDTQRMAIKEKTTHGLSHGWANLEKGFNTEEEMEERFNELLESDEYEEG